MLRRGSKSFLQSIPVSEGEKLALYYRTRVRRWRPSSRFGLGGLSFRWRVRISLRGARFSRWLIRARQPCWVEKDRDSLEKVSVGDARSTAYYSTCKVSEKC